MAKSKKNVILRKNMQRYRYLSPAIISISVLSILPILYTIFIAFTNYTLKNQNYGYGTAKGWEMVGLYQFKQVLAGPLKSEFFPLLGWTLVYTTICYIRSIYHRTWICNGT